MCGTLDAEHLPHEADDEVEWACGGLVVSRAGDCGLGRHGELCTQSAESFWAVGAVVASFRHSLLKRHGRYFVGLVRPVAAGCDHELDTVVVRAAFLLFCALKKDKI